MTKKVDYTSPLIPCELDVYLKLERGLSVVEVAKSRQIETSSTTVLAHRAARKLGIRASQIRGSLALLSERQRAKLCPRNKVMTDAFGSDAAPWPPAFCPCCSKPWPVAADTAGTNDAAPLFE